MSYLRQIEELLHDAGAELSRSKKHKVYRFPDGRIWVVAGTPRSDNSWKTNLHDLQKFLGHDLSAHTNPNRKVKRGVERKVRFEQIAAPVRDWTEGLREFAMANPTRNSLKAPEFPECQPYQVSLIHRTPVQVILGRFAR